MVRKSSRCIARESSESAYRWDRKGGGKTEVVGLVNSVE